MSIGPEYKLYLDFINKYKTINFEDVDKDDPLVLQVENTLIKNKQFFYVGDLLKLKMIYVSNSCFQSLGIKSSEFEPGINFSITHPDDVQRHTVGRAQLIKLGHETFENNDDYAFMSTNLRFQHSKGHYTNFIIQLYFFSVQEPHHNIFVFGLYTDIDWFGPIKHGYHYYLGEDLSQFRLPDKELILTGCIFTEREFEIVRLLRNGLESLQIADKLFISPHTVDTHRRNILKKTGKASTSELIIELQESGFF